MTEPDSTWLRQITPKGNQIPKFLDVGILVDSEIVLSTSYGKTMVFINKNLINRDRLSTRPYQQRPLINKVDSW